MKKFIFDELKQNNSDIHVIFDTYIYPEESHIHDFFEIIYINSGSFFQTINDKTYKCGRGDLILIDTNSTHSFRAVGASSHFNICFRISDEEERFGELGEIRKLLNKSVLSFSGENRRELENILQTMYREERNAENFTDEMLDNYAHILLIKILRKMNEKQTIDNDNWEDILSYIHENIDEQLSLHQIASRCFYNPSYFSRIFKQKMGVSFISYVNNLKIEKAKDLLENTDMSIIEISNELGFSSVQVFYKTFGSFEKNSPLKYREKMKKKFK